MAKSVAVPRPAGQKWLMAIGRQRELSLLAIMFVLGAGVSLMAPQFLTVNNISQVAALAAVVAVAAVGEAIVIITRGIDLSVEAMIGLVAYSVARSLELQLVDPIGALAMGLAIGLVLGMINGFIVAVLKVPAIVATLGTLSIFRGIDYVIAGPDQVPLAGLPEGFTDLSRADIFGIPVFVLIAVGVVIVDPCSSARRASAARCTRSAATPRRLPSWASPPAWSRSWRSRYAACWPASPA